jgi:hypothetical protein
MRQRKSRPKQPGRDAMAWRAARLESMTRTLADARDKIAREGMGCISPLALEVAGCDAATWWHDWQARGEATIARWRAEVAADRRAGFGVVPHE